MEKTIKKDIWTDIPRVHRTTLSIYHAFVGAGGLIDKKEDEMNQPPLVCPNILGANNVFLLFFCFALSGKRQEKREAQVSLSLAECFFLGCIS